MVIVSTNALITVVGVVAASVQSAGAATTLEPNFYVRTWGQEGTLEELAQEEACIAGEFQSPVNINPDFKRLQRLPDELVAHMAFPTIKDPYVSNTGHGIQV